MLIDPRAGSGQFLEPLQNLDVPAESCYLDAGDAVFAGQGPAGVPLIVGVEVKRLAEIPETIRTGRFASQQLHALLDNCDQAWLLVHGRGIRSTDDTLALQNEHRGGRWFPAVPPIAADTVTSWYVSMSTLTPLHVTQVESFDAAVYWLASFWRWWQRPWHQHTAPKQLYHAAQRTSHPLAQLWSTRQDPDTLLRRMAKELPHVGWERSAAVAQHFGTIDRFTAALADPNPKDWLGIKGVGKGIAADIVASLLKRVDS